jgi:hypothetical protein
MLGGEALHNLVTVCMLDPAIEVAVGDTQAAVDFVAGKASEMMQEFHQATREAIQQWPGRSRSILGDVDIDNATQIRLYADVLRDAVVGNYFWHVDPRTVRYSVFADEESRRARRVTIPN